MINIDKTEWHILIKLMPPKEDIIFIINLYTASDTALKYRKKNCH